MAFTTIVDKTNDRSALLNFFLSISFVVYIVLSGKTAEALCIGLNQDLYTLPRIAQELSEAT